MAESQRSKKDESLLEKQDPIDDIEKYYHHNLEDSRHTRQQLEFRVTSRILKMHLDPSSRILEIGAAAGYYTSELAKAGHSVVAVDLSPSLIEKNKIHIEELGLTQKVDFHVIDARNIADLRLGDFDAVLAMGPFYHLILQEERTRLMMTLRSHLREGGMLFTTHLTRAGFISYMLYKYPFWVHTNKEQVDEIWNQGYFLKHRRDGSFRGYFCTLDEIRESHENAGLTDLNLHSQDPLIGGCDELFNRLPEPVKEDWVEQSFKMSSDQLSLGSGRSVLCVGVKKSRIR